MSTEVLRLLGSLIETNALAGLGSAGQQLAEAYRAWQDRQSKYCTCASCRQAEYSEEGV